MYKTKIKQLIYNLKWTDVSVNRLRRYNIIMKQVGYFTRDLRLVFLIRNFEPIIASYIIPTSIY